jgi:LysM repeat protein
MKYCSSACCLFWIGLLLLIFGSPVLRASAYDSIGLENRNGTLYIQHKVETGEDIRHIARRYSANVETLIALNPFARYPLKKGQIVRIPYKGRNNTAAIRSYTVRPDDTLYKIATKFGTTPQALKELNHMSSDYIRAGQELLVYQNKTTNADTTQTKEVSTLSYQYHTVEPNETLYKIATRYKVTVAQIKEWNKLENDKIRDGQKLIVGKSEVFRGADTNAPTKRFQKSQSAVCAMIDRNTSSTSYYGLHKTLPEGTIVRIFNESTGRSIDVKIIGKLPNISVNENISIRINKAACHALGTNASQFPVILSW